MAATFSALAAFTFHRMYFEIFLLLFFFADIQLIGFFLKEKKLILPHVHEATGCFITIEKIFTSKKQSLR